jgi:hypothetical protein
MLVIQSMYCVEHIYMGDVFLFSDSFESGTLFIKWRQMIAICKKKNRLYDGA